MRSGNGIVGIDAPDRVVRYKKRGTYSFLLIVVLTALFIAGGVLLYVIFVPGDSAPIAYIIGSLLILLGIIFLPLGFFIPRTINQSYIVVSRLQKEYRIDDLRQLARQSTTGSRMRVNQQKRMAIGALGDLKAIEAIPDLEWTFRFCNKADFSLVKFIAEALAKIGTRQSVVALKSMNIQLQEALAEKQKIKFKSSHERSSITFLSRSLNFVNSYLHKLAIQNNFSSAVELFSSLEAYTEPSTSSDFYEDYSSQTSFPRELSQAEILTSQSILDTNKFFILSKFDIISLLLIFLGIIPGIISFLIFLPIRISYLRIRRLKEEENVSELIKIVRECKSSFYGSFTTRFAIYALGDLRKQECIAALRELVQKRDELCETGVRGISRLERIVKDASQTLDYVSKIVG
jgi:hypothetical protein